MTTGEPLLSRRRLVVLPCPPPSIVKPTMQSASARRNAPSLTGAAPEQRLARRGCRNAAREPTYRRRDGSLVNGFGRTGCRHIIDTRSALVLSDKDRPLGPGTRDRSDCHRVLDPPFTDQRCDRGDIGSRFVRKRSACRQMVLIPTRSGIVGGKKAGRSVAIVQLSKKGRTRQNIVVRIVGIGAEAVTSAKARPCRRHDLHQAHRAFRREGVDIFPALGMHDGADPRHGNPEPL